MGVGSKVARDPNFTLTHHISSVGHPSSSVYLEGCSSGAREEHVSTGSSYQDDFGASSPGPSLNLNSDWVFIEILPCEVGGSVRRASSSKFVGPEAFHSSFDDD